MQHECTVNLIVAPVYGDKDNIVKQIGNTLVMALFWISYFQWVVSECIIYQEIH